MAPFGTLRTSSGWRRGRHETIAREGARTHTRGELAGLKELQPPRHMPCASMSDLARRGRCVCEADLQAHVEQVRGLTSVTAHDRHRLTLSRQVVSLSCDIKSSICRNFSANRATWRSIVMATQWRDAKRRLMDRLR